MGFLPLSATVSTHTACRQPPSGQFRVYGVTQLRADGVHCRESANPGIAVLKAVLVTGAAFQVSPLDQCLCASLFPYPLLVCSVQVFKRVESVRSSVTLQELPKGITKETRYILLIVLNIPSSPFVKRAAEGSVVAKGVALNKLYMK